MAKKKRKVKSASKIGRYLSVLAARPGEEPVLEEPKKTVRVKPKKEKIHVKELKSAAEVINSIASQQSAGKESSKDEELKEIEEEFNEEYSGVLKNVEKQTSKWKKTGDTGLYMEPSVTWKDKVDKVVDSYRKKKSEMDKKRWVKLEQIKNKPKKSLLPKLFKRKKKQWIPPSPKKVSEVYEELLDRTKSLEKEKKPIKDEIDNIYKQLKSK
ncbi:hypothetical protein KY329_03020 [Candidatus Woesearchaeota archaeon]|nr:hypothetical protein [Candidatus Woesearchaeota archaeon]